ncbi:hypothetical protein O1611_g1783 [Lasiodiplodia mahajangana]|uniref:Uncharacterized protein n=1 Tax=Lasiodiplodia mahajangana TaxID=1108764 RepID=A0ACC2JXB4_9PEZI|nr:hypothetical protein O1611_g1783 [Lasiodiplodia mahajangana]
MELNTQIYHELFPRETRLATIKPGQWSDFLRCSLVIFPLDYPRKTGYKALSYVWGSRDRTEDISVNGQNHKVTVNLACAIRHLRHPETPVDIWIDAICINQSSASEKTAQVALMRDIYAGAEQVIVFLGDGVNHRISKAYWIQTPPPPVVFWNDSRDDDYLRVLHNSLNPLSRKNGCNAFYVACVVRLLSQPSNYHYAKATIKRVGTRRHRELFELLRFLLVEPWWQRIWVVQEVVIPQKVTIRYGNVTAPWEMFVQAAETARSQGDQLGIEPEYMKVLSVFTRQVLDIENLRKKWDIEKGTDLLSLLQRFSDRKATDERDKIYALLGIAKDEALLIPDYSIDICTLYENAALALIRNCGNLSPISGDLKRKNSRNLPSWVTDWSAIIDKSDNERMSLQCGYPACSNWRLAVFKSKEQYWSYAIEQMDLLVRDLRFKKPRKITRELRDNVLDYMERINPKDERNLLDNTKVRIHQLCRLFLDRTEEFDGGLDPDRLNAETEELFNFSTIYTTHRPKGQLQIESKFMGKVLWCKAKLITWDDVDSALHTVSTWLRSILPPDWRKDPYEAHQRMHRFMRTLVGGIYWNEEGVHQMCPDDYESLAKWFAISLLPRLHPSIMDDLEWFIHPFRISVFPAPIKSFDREMRLMTEGRVFFATEDNEMGLGPSSMGEGDGIYTLPGGQTHFVLRRVNNYMFGNNYVVELIGDCFLDVAPGTSRPRIGLNGSLHEDILSAESLKRLTVVMERLSRPTTSSVELTVIPTNSLEHGDGPTIAHSFEEAELQMPVGDLHRYLKIAGSFFIHFITLGLSTSFGSYQAYYEEDYLASSSPSAISWIGTTQVFLLSFLGLFSGAVYDRGYFREVLASGLALVVLGMGLLGSAREFWQVFLAQGLCVGLGSGLIYVPAISAVSNHFVTHRTLALGVAASGAAAGGVIWPIAFLGAASLAILVFVWLNVHQVAGITVWCFFLGFTAGSVITIPNAVASRLSKPSNTGQRIGIMWTAGAFAELVGTPIAGTLVTQVNGKTNYLGGQLFGGLSILIGAAFLIAPAWSIFKDDRTREARLE